MTREGTRTHDGELSGLDVGLGVVGLFVVGAGGLFGGILAEGGRDVDLGSHDGGHGSAELGWRAHIYTPSGESRAAEVVR